MILHRETQTLFSVASCHTLRDFLWITVPHSDAVFSKWWMGKESATCWRGGLRTRSTKFLLLVFLLKGLRDAQCAWLMAGQDPDFFGEPLVSDWRWPCSLCQLLIPWLERNSNSRPLRFRKWRNDTRWLEKQKCVNQTGSTWKKYRKCWLTPGNLCQGKSMALFNGT